MDVQPTEIELLQLLHTGDVKAFDAIYRKYVKPVHQNILKIVVEDEASLDILQEVFILLWQKRRQVKTNQSAGGWLFVVSYNLSIKHLRQVARTQKEITHYSMYSNTAAFSQEDTNREENVQHEINALQQAIDELPARKKQVFTLCRLEGKTYAEAATILGISKETVKEYLQSTSKMLKNKIIRDTAYSLLPFYMCCLLVSDL